MISTEEGSKGPGHLRMRANLFAAAQAKKGRLMQLEPVVWGNITLGDAHQDAHPYSAR
jgi:hypothetical protein